MSTGLRFALLCAGAGGSPALALLPGLLLAAILGSVPAARAGTVEGTVHLDALPPVQPGAAYRGRTRSPILPRDAARAVVWLEPANGAYPAVTAAAPVQIAQEGYQFRPGITAVQVGTAARFPNRDEEFHSVFSYSQAKRFDLGRYRKDEETPAIGFDQPGVVKIYCEIHKHMRSIVVVVESPWFVVTDENGTFRLDDIPAGDYRVKAWLPTDRTVEDRLQVPDGPPVRIDLGGR